MVRFRVLVAAGTAALLLVPAAPAAAETVDSSCTKSLTRCIAVKRVKKKLYFDFGRKSGRRPYRLCVTPPTGRRERECKSFRLRRVAGVLFQSVRFGLHFGNYGPGRYRVTWSQSGRQVGPALRFTIHRPK